MSRTKQLVIKGGKRLRGEINVRGSKNAALPLLAATLLTDQKCKLSNLPRIEDVERMLEILESLGAEIKREDQHTVEVKAADIDPDKIDYNLVGKIRASILLVGPLLSRFKKITLPQPGGCKIGARPLDTHFQAFQDLGVSVEIEKSTRKNDKRPRDYYQLKKPRKFKTGKIVLNEFSVTATENILLTAATIPKETTIKIAASEPHVQDLCAFLQAMGAEIKGVGTHTIKIRGQENLDGTDHKIVPDYLETGTFTILGVATRSRISINKACIEHLDLTFKKLKKMGANLRLKKGSSKGEDKIIINPASALKAINIEARPYPGVPTDLQAPFGVLTSQAEGTSIIHDTLYEGRLKYVKELNKMGASAIIADPHRALITGPTPLYGREIESYDIRAGATLIIAGLIAEGETVINDIYQVDRGYEDIDERLKKLGANIKRR